MNTPVHVVFEKKKKFDSFFTQSARKKTRVLLFNLEKACGCIKGCHIR